MGNIKFQRSYGICVLEFLMTDNVVKDKNEYRKWFQHTIVIILILCVFIAIVNIVVDPFFHYHAPVVKYRLHNERYINDGIARNFDYDAIIIGNSLTQNFKISQYDELFGVNGVKLPYSGANTAELWTALGRAIGREAVTPEIKDGIPKEYRKQYDALNGYNDDVDTVLICIDCDDIVNEKFWVGYDSLPEYLYDDNLLNDVEYVFNKDTLYKGTLFNLILTVRGRESTSFDEYSAWEREKGPYQACDSLELIEKVDESDFVEFTPNDRKLADLSLKYNILPVVRANQNTRFIFVLPPFSIAKWAEYYQDGKIMYRIDSMYYILSELIKYDNVSIYGFDDEFELITNLDIYCDAIHYDADINDWMLGEIAADRHKIEADSIERYFQNIRDFYLNYDYTVLNEYID